MTRRQCHKLVASGAEEHIGGDDRAPTCSWSRVTKAFSISSSAPAFRTESCNPFACAASCMSAMKRSVSGIVGFTSRAITLAPGTSSETSSSRFGVSSPPIS